MRVKGTQVVTRGDQTVGTARFVFVVDDRGRVTGRIFDLELMGLHRSAGTVSIKFLPEEGATLARDLALALPDGRRVEFLVPKNDGYIDNGVVVEQRSA